MRKISKRFATVMIVAACVFFVHGTKFVIESFGRNARKVDGKIKGDDKAPIKVVEFIDFQCPGCALGFEYLNKKMKEHPGMIRVEVKHYPLQMHRHGFLSS